MFSRWLVVDAATNGQAKRDAADVSVNGDGLGGICGIGLGELGGVGISIKMQKDKRDAADATVNGGSVGLGTVKRNDHGGEAQTRDVEA